MGARVVMQDGWYGVPWQSGGPCIDYVSAEVVACVSAVRFCAWVCMLSFGVCIQLEGEGGGVNCCFGVSLHVMCQKVESDTLLW